jgi:hypothetical protein
MDGTAMPAIRVLQGTVFGMRKQFSSGLMPLSPFLNGATFQIGNPPELVTIGGALDLIEGEYLAVAVKRGLFSDRGSVALAYRRLGQKADAEPTRGFSGFFCLLTAALILLCALVGKLSLSAQPVLASGSAVLVALLILIALHRRQLARSAAQALSRLSLDRPPPPQVHRTAATPADIERRPISQDPLRWVVFFLALLVVLVVAGLEALFALNHDVRTAKGLAPFLVMVVILFGVLIAAYFVPPGEAEVRWHDSAQSKWMRGAVGISIGALVVGGGIYIGRHGQYYVAYPAPGGRSVILIYIITWLWDCLGDVFGAWGPAGVTLVAGLAICCACIGYLRRS